MVYSTEIMYIKLIQLHKIREEKILNYSSTGGEQM